MDKPLPNGRIKALTLPPLGGGIGIRAFSERFLTSHALPLLSAYKAWRRIDTELTRPNPTRMVSIDEPP